MSAELISLDTNILVYSVDLDAGVRHDKAIEIFPVSYTHLRAHETVLDLVCRLLLEKKNNKNK